MKERVVGSSLGDASFLIKKKCYHTCKLKYKKHTCKLKDTPKHGKLAAGRGKVAAGTVKVAARGGRGRKTKS